jgi:hypothetical protein
MLLFAESAQKRSAPEFNFGRTSRNKAKQTKQNNTNTQATNKQNKKHQQTAMYQESRSH